MPNATFAGIAEQLAGRLTILRMQEPLIQIRGCFVELPGKEELLFAGSLWVTELEALTELGIAGSMLPPNEPLLDLLMTHRLMMTAQQSSQRAQAAAREAESRRQIETLEEVNRRLDAAVRERTTDLERINAELTQLLRSMPR
jgi:C4-dicarboxylate-specific signal transduction histidine kinase